MENCVEKIYCCDRDNNDNALAAAILANGGISWGNLTFKGEPIEAGTDTLTWTSTQITCMSEQITA